MSDDDFEDDAEPDLEDDLEEDLDEDVLDDDVVGEVVDDVVLDVVDDDAEGAVIEIVVAVVPDEDDGETDDEDDVMDLDEELHPDDVEEPLDVLLQERTASQKLDEDEEDVFEDDGEPDDPRDGSTKIVPRRPGEFLCSSCFLVLPRHQLADEKKMLCRDCA